MRKISLTALYQNGKRALAIATLTLLGSVSVLAENNCDTHAALINPAHLAHSGIGGTGAVQFGIGDTGLYEGGIGGTGAPEGGIGGTGNVVQDGGIGGTGIIGIITGFASICVNGVEIHYDINTPVTVDGRLSTARDLAPGQVVSVRASGAGPELTAQTIAVMHAAIGPVSSLNSWRGEMQVLGQTVQAGQSGDHNRFSNLKTGDWVQVSGHRLSNGTIAASRIETTPPRQEARLNGYVTQIDSQGFEVNGTRVQHDAGLLPPGLTRGMEVSVAGRWDGAHLKAQHIQPEPTRQSIGNVDHVVIEGYVHALDGKELNLGNRIIALEPDTRITGRNDLKVDQRIQVSGRSGADQRINPERIEIKQGLTPYIQERIDGNLNDRSDKEGKKNTNDAFEGKPAHADNDGKDRGGRDSEPGRSRAGELKREIDNNSGKDRDSGGDSHAKDENDFSRGENKSDRPDSRKNEKPADSDHRSDAISSEGKTIDAPERPENPDARESAGDLRDSPRDRDIPDTAREQGGHQDRDMGQRDMDNHRDSVRDRDIPDRIRDHDGRHDRDSGHRDRDFDR